MMRGVTDGRDRLHELVLLQLEEDGGFARSVQPEGHHADLHLRPDVDPVVLEQEHLVTYWAGWRWMEEWGGGGGGLLW